MSGQSEPTSTGDNRLQTPEQVWSTFLYWSNIGLYFNFCAILSLCLLVYMAIWWWLNWWYHQIHENVIYFCSECVFGFSGYYLYNFFMFLANKTCFYFPCETWKNPQTLTSHMSYNSVKNNCTQTLSHDVQTSRCCDYDSLQLWIGSYDAEWSIFVTEDSHKVCFCVCCNLEEPLNTIRNVNWAMFEHIVQLCYYCICKNYWK